MKSLFEYLKEAQSFEEFVNGEQIDEGLKEWVNKIKTKFSQVFNYLRGVVVKIGDYFMSVDGDGNVTPCITPPTSGNAYKNGLINKKSTFVHVDKESSKIVKLNNKFTDALSLYPKESSIKYWDRMLNENVESDYEPICEDFKTINEVKLQNSDPEAKYNIIVDDDELKAEIKMNLMDHELARLMIWGAPGIGKTAILSNVLEEMRKEFPNYSLIVKTLSNETPDNFTLPKYIDVEGQEFATDVPKTWLPVYKPSGDPVKDKQLDDMCGAGLLFIDELSRATPQVLNVILPLVNEGKFNGYQLGSQWTIICASNRAEDDGGQSEIGTALSNRFTQLHYEPTVHTWRKWADKQGFMSPLLLQWLSLPASENLSGGKFFYMDPNEGEDSGDTTTLMCTPRAWTNAMRRLAKYSHTGSLEGFTIFDIPTRIIQRVLNGCVPASAVDSFIAFLDVIRGIGDFDRMVHDVWNNGGGSFKLDKKTLNKISLPIAQLICTAHCESLPSENEFENLCNWLIAQNSDQLASYTMDIFKHVFDANDDLGDALFVIREKMKKFADPEFVKKNNIRGSVDLITGAAEKFAKARNIDVEDIPNYYNGMVMLAKKYRDAFKAMHDDLENA